MRTREEITNELKDIFDSWLAHIPFIGTSMLNMAMSAQQTELLLDIRDLLTPNQEGK